MDFATPEMQIHSPDHVKRRIVLPGDESAPIEVDSNESAFAGHKPAMTSACVDFSVVIPLFNKAPHVATAVGSALSQTLSPREIIVVDDGSTDGSLEIIRAIADPRLTIAIRSPPGPGGYAARNMGVMAATGEWVAFLDADDCWHPRHLADLSRAIRAAGPKAGCAFSGSIIRQKDRDRPYPMASSLLKPDAANELTTILRAWLQTQRCPLWTGAVAFRRTLLIEAGLFPADQARRGGDKDLWLRCIARAPAAYAPALSAEFNQDTVNRVTTSTGHADIPVICGTISRLLETADRPTARLLRQLSNQEIALYVRHATRAGVMPKPDFLRSLYFPEGLRTMGMILAYMAIAYPLRLRRRRRPMAD